MRAALLFLGVMLLFGESGFASEACAIDESTITCVLIEQRNYVMNELVTAEAGRRDAIKLLAAQKLVDDYWKSYVAGLAQCTPKE